MNLEGSTIEEAASSLTRLRSYAPFRFGGTWYVSLIGNQAVAYRALRDLKKRATKAGMSSIAYATVCDKAN